MFLNLPFTMLGRSLRDYAIYFLTLTFGVCLFYVFNSMDSQQAMASPEFKSERDYSAINFRHWLCIHFISLYLRLLVVYSNRF